MSPSSQWLRSRLREWSGSEGMVSGVICGVKEILSVETSCGSPALSIRSSSSQT